MTEIMNNGGGPEPHQGSNPGAQSDPGPKEVGFYDLAQNHVLGDDGIQAAAERPSPMRMGGVGGSQPNQGQRGGQNTGTSGAQTSAYSSFEEYGAGSGDEIDSPGSPEFDQAGAKPVSGGGSVDSETRNPVGFASEFARDAQPMHEPGHSAYVDELGAEGGAYVYQSRAAQKLVDMREDAGSPYARMDEPSEDRAPRMADKAGEVADAVKGKAGGFFSGAKDKVEGFLNVDLDDDGAVGRVPRVGRASSYDDGSHEMGYERETPATRSYEAGAGGSGSGGAGAMAATSPQSFETREARPHDKMGNPGSAPEAFEMREARSRTEAGDRGARPEAFETREAKPRGMDGNSGSRPAGASERPAPDTSTFNNASGHERSLPDMADRSVMRSDGVSRTEAQQRELVDA